MKQIVRKPSATAALALILVSLAAYSCGQESSSEGIPGDFLELADLRGTLEAEVAELKLEIRDIEARSENVAGQKKDLATLKQAIARLDKEPSLSAGEQNVLEVLQMQAAVLEDDLVELDAARSLLPDRKTRLAESERRAHEVQAKIAGLLDPADAYKRTMSITFSILIAVVIVGFFVISWKDDRIRQAIFSGQAGIQFLTLFSLVIAIILFGMTGILEGKELGALLGGLSGYILGRVTGEKSGGTGGGGGAPG